MLGGEKSPNPIIIYKPIKPPHTIKPTEFAFLLVFLTQVSAALYCIMTRISQCWPINKLSTFTSQTTKNPSDEE